MWRDWMWHHMHCLNNNNNDNNNNDDDDGDDNVSTICKAPSMKSTRVPV